MDVDVKRMYSDIYRSYDIANAVFSFGTMGLWRKIAAKEAMRGGMAHDILDVATGTGELAFEIARRAGDSARNVRIIGVDFNSDMLNVARVKARRRGVSIKFDIGAVMDLKYANGSFDMVTSGFGLKNLDDLQRFAEEVRRVLKIGGRFVFMDMARPENRVGEWLIEAYWGLLGSLCKVAGKSAYCSIISSINDFDKYGFVKTLKNTGFGSVKIRRLAFGPAFLITGRRLR